MSETYRRASCAGTFYAKDPASLRGQIEGCFEHPLGPGLASARHRGPLPVALIAPHAGYIYSGPIAAHAYEVIRRSVPPGIVVLIGPNHQARGAAVAVPKAGHWQTPLGQLTVDKPCSEALRKLCPFLAAEDLAHQLEHSIEVQLPFLQFTLAQPAPIVPIVMADQRLEPSRELGVALATLLRDRKAVIIASSDFSHYETHAWAKRNDRFALDAIEALDADAFRRAIVHQRLSICGPGPIVAAITAAREQGVKHGKVLRYATSGEMSGNYDQVVAYAAVALGPVATEAANG